jgi:outer membrane protein assembly factor BamB
VFLLSARNLALFALVGAIGVGPALSLTAKEDKPTAKPEAVKEEPTADWPLFRGNALQTGVATTKLPEKLEILWKFEAKDGIEGTPAIVNGTVYVGAMFKDENLYALDLATGTEKWRYKAGGIKAPVSVHAGKVYAGNIDGVLHCVDAATGKRIWKFEAPAEITSGANFDGDRVLFGCADQNLYCLSGKGEKLWKFEVGGGGPVLASPAIINYRTFVAGCDSTLHILDTRSGKQETAVDLGGQIAATAAVVGDRLFVGTMSHQVLAVDWKKGKVAWSFEAPKLKQEFRSSPAVTEKLVIIGSQDRRVWALDRATGKEAWSFLTRGTVESSPVVVGSRVIVGSLDRKLYVLDLAKGTLLKKFDLDGPVVGSPAVSGGKLVIGTDRGTLYCIGAKK